MQAFDDANKAIRVELYRALDLLGADPKLLGIVGSWGNTAEDAEVYAALKSWNEEHGKLIMAVRAS